MGENHTIDSFFRKRGLRDSDSEGSRKRSTSDVILSSSVPFYSEWTLNHKILKRVYHHDKKSRELGIPEKLRVIGLDLDSTLVKTKTSVPHPRNEDDWHWFNSCVKTKLRDANHAENTIIVIFSNQGGVVAGGKRYITFTRRLDHIMDDLNAARESESIEVWAYAAIKVKTEGKGQKVAASKSSKLKAKIQEEEPTENPGDTEKSLKIDSRKPGIGLWLEFLDDLKAEYGAKLEVDLSNSVYVGDAAGRKNDFSDSDKKFAENVGLTFLTPEEYFVENEDES